jgi:hypothetical protein
VKLFSRRWQRIALAVLFAFLGLAFLCPDPAAQQSSLIPSTSQDIESFLKLYWQRPIPPQGVVPTYFTKKEASLHPEACGSCHPRQYADWKESLHSKAMGPGPWGQIVNLTNTNPAETGVRMTCHAPLSEQMACRRRGWNRKSTKPGRESAF